MAIWPRMMWRSLKFVAYLLMTLLVSVHWRGYAHPAADSLQVLCEDTCPNTPGPSLEALRQRFRRPGPPPFPEDNPFTQAKYDLGRQLFFEPLLSGSGTHSCASCHDPGLSWGDGLPRAIGDTGVTLPLRAPTLLNLAWISIMGWDGKFPGLEEVTFIPIMGRTNMDLDEATATARIASVPGYVDAFSVAFGDRLVDRERIENAIATYERTLVSTQAPFDRWVDGQADAIDDAAKRGFVLFNGQANCAACHSGWAFTDGSFHDIGSADGDDVGRGRLFPSSVKLRYAFKVPTLRDTAQRAPYMHDGSVPSLAAVIDLYDRGGIDRPSRSPEIKPLHLSPQQKADLLAFLETLTGAPDPTTPPNRPR